MRNSKTYLHPFQDELVYYPKKNGKECEFCGLSSIAHKHKPGTLPKDYERIEDEPMSNSTQNDCNCVMSGYAQTTNGCPVHKYSTQNETLGIPEWDENMQEAYDRGYRKGLADARKEGIREGRSQVIKIVLDLRHTGGEDCDCSGSMWHSNTKIWECDYNDTLYDVLATLREEEQVVEKNI